MTPEALARKWCRRHRHPRIGVLYECECPRIKGAIREALEAAEQIAQAVATQAAEQDEGEHFPTADTCGAIVAAQEIGRRIAALRGGTG